MDPATIATLRDLALIYFAILGILLLLVPLVLSFVTFRALRDVQKQMRGSLMTLQGRVGGVKTGAKRASRGLLRITASLAGVIAGVQSMLRRLFRR